MSVVPSVCCLLLEYVLLGLRIAREGLDGSSDGVRMELAKLFLCMSVCLSVSVSLCLSVSVCFFFLVPNRVFVVPGEDLRSVNLSSSNGFKA